MSSENPSENPEEAFRDYKTSFEALLGELRVFKSNLQLLDSLLTKAVVSQGVTALVERLRWLNTAMVRPPECADIFSLTEEHGADRVRTLRRLTERSCNELDKLLPKLAISDNHPLAEGLKRLKERLNEMGQSTESYLQQLRTDSSAPSISPTN